MKRRANETITASKVVRRLTGGARRVKHRLVPQYVKLDMVARLAFIHVLCCHNVAPADITALRSRLSTADLHKLERTALDSARILRTFAADLNTHNVDTNSYVM